MQCNNLSIKDQLTFREFLWHKDSILKSYLKLHFKMLEGNEVGVALK